MNVLYNSGITIVITTVCRSSACDPCVVEVDLKYVSILKRIIQVRYGIDTLQTLMECSWIRPNLEGIYGIDI